MNSSLRLLLSAAVSFAFYFAWAYWANSSPDVERSMTTRSALVQGSYSGFVTVSFTMILEQSVRRFGGHCLSLAFVTPILCGVYSKTRQNQAIFATFNHALDLSAQKLDRARLPGALLAPLLPLAVQSTLLIGVNVFNQTPNLWLTVAPSILFSGIYGYAYTFTLLKRNRETDDAEALAPAGR